MESEESYTVQQAESPLMQRIDIQATYKMSAVLPHLYHIPVTYMNKGEYNAFASRRLQMYNKTGLALWMHNNCQALSSRESLVAQLMQLMPIDSPGRCLNNMDAAGVNRDAPVELMAHYKFYIVFENVFGDPDWVSSTFFRALDAGTVPVVLAYQEYLQWKESGPTQEFQSLMATSDTNPFCRMCIAAAQGKQWAFDDAHRERLKQFAELRAAFDVLNAQLDEDRAVACRGRDKWWHIELPENQTFYTTHENALPADVDISHAAAV
eukprot:gene9681-9839_t